MSSWAKYELKTNNNKRDNLHFWFVENGFFDVQRTVAWIFIFGHSLALLGYYKSIAERAYYTFMWANAMQLFIAMGASCGAHLLWCHRCYDARWPLRLVYMIAQTMSGQYSLYHWCRDHRTHHKWSDTDADPYNPSRGFTFAHMGWLMKRKHPEMRIRGKTLDYSDLMKDPIVKFQWDHYASLFFVFSFALPVAIPVWLWNESWWTSFLISFIGRFVLTTHGTMLINSAAHMWGEKPYNSKIAPTDNVWVSAITFGTGYHNYHHMFPSDYTSSEPHRKWNLARDFIDGMAKLGLAYNLKQTSKAVVDKTKDKAERERTNFYGTWLTRSVLRMVMKLNTRVKPDESDCRF
ncbi:Delta(9)-fatty-acid desaturase fat-6 [Halotydeus destructor]|nr:Delta(9)-fatty-acid desaturase fat-6 [Halotydeus destructor]